MISARRGFPLGLIGLVAVISLGLFVAVPAAAIAQLVPPALSQRALIEGSVPIIVHLGVRTMPEGALSGSAAMVQRQGISVAQQDVLTALAGLSHRVRHRYQTLPLLALEVDPVALGRLNTLTGIVSRIDEDELSAPLLAQSVPLVQGNAAWDAGFTGSGRVIAILDTGVDKTHSFLSGKVTEEACYSANGNCPNGSTSQVGAGAGVPCTYASACVHGTHVAGIAAGVGSSFSGVAKGAKLMSVQVFSRFTGSNCGGEDPCALSYSSDQIAGLERVYTLRTTYAFDAVNMSLGGGRFSSNCNSDSRKLAIDNLRSVGIATVVASGNSGYSDSLSAPACISTAVSVGSTNDGSSGTIANTISFFSNSASFLSLLAPGAAITSSVPGGFDTFEGTSMATPHVAGAWAVLRQAKPTATVPEVLSALQTTGLPITDARNGVTKSRIKIRDALIALGTSAPPTGYKTYVVPPCRLVDTRLAGGAIPANGSRTFLAAGPLSGQGGAANCLVPDGAAKAVHVNVVAVGASGEGHLTLHPYPTAPPVASALNFSTGQTVANGILIPICNSSVSSCPFDFTVTMGPAAAHVVIDVTGYLAPKP